MDFWTIVSLVATILSLLAIGASVLISDRLYKKSLENYKNRRL